MPDQQGAEEISYYTVVYRVKGGKKAHEEWWQSIKPAFLADQPISVISLTHGDLTERVDELETASEALNDVRI